MEIIGGGTPDTNNTAYWNGSIDWYSPTEIGNKPYVSGSLKKISVLGLQKSSAKILPANKTILFTSRAGIGDMAILTKQGTTNQGFQSFILENDVDIYFLYSMGFKIKDFALKNASGSTFLEISKSQLSQMRLYLPSLKEQTQIGNFFKQFDDTIALHQRELEKFKILKTFYLENIFLGKVSLFTAKNTITWEQRKLGELGYTFNGLNGKSKDDFGHGSAKYITYMNVYKNPIATLEELDLIEIDKSQNEIKKGDILFTTSSETPEEVGLSSVWMYEITNIYLNSFCFGFRLEQKISINYMAYMLRSNSIRNKITLLAQGISRYNISKKGMMNIEVFLPSYAEQTQIGNFFKQLDDTIALHQKELAKYQQIKAACLEKMFVE